MNNKITWEQSVQQLREDPQQQALVKACFYDDPIEEAAERYFQSGEWKAIQKETNNLTKGTALDIGAGRGIASYALAKDGWKVTALEPDNSEIVGTGCIKHLSNTANLGINIVQEFAEKLPFPDNSFDLVHARQVLHHANNLEMFCAEIFRVLKPGGTLIATREHVISKQSDLPIFLDNHPLHNLYGGENAYLLSTYQKAITSSGLKLYKTLGPYDSDINLYPESRTGYYQRIKNKLKLPLPEYCLHIILKLYQRLDQRPGRLYSFIGRKNG